MTIDVKTEFEATYTESLWGGNQSGFVLKKDGNPCGRIEIPSSTGNQEQDAVLLQNLERAVQAWEATGTILKL